MNADNILHRYNFNMYISEPYHFHAISLNNKLSKFIRNLKRLAFFFKHIWARDGNLYGKTMFQENQTTTILQGTDFTAQ